MDFFCSAGVFLLSLPILLVFFECSLGTWVSSHRNMHVRLQVRLAINNSMMKVKYPNVQLSKLTSVSKRRKMFDDGKTYIVHKINRSPVWQYYK